MTMRFGNDSFALLNDTFPNLNDTFLSLNDTFTSLNDTFWFKMQYYRRIFMPALNTNPSSGA